MTIEIELTKGYKTKIDDIDRDLAELNWYAKVTKSGNIYACRDEKVNGVKKNVLLHITVLSRMLNEKPNGICQVDHKDLDGLNNTRDNLREATHSQNQANKSKYKNNKSGYKGVHWSKVSNKWTSQLRHNNVIYYLGIFDDIEDARKAYQNKAKELHKEFARYD